MKTLEKVGDYVRAEGVGFYCGLDLGQDRDYSALVILERVWRAELGPDVYEHHIRFAKRYPHYTLYPDVAADAVENVLHNEKLVVRDLPRTPPYGYRERPLLVIDAGGPGKAVRDELIRRGDVRKREFVAVVLTGGLTESRGDGGTYNVPKSRLLEQLKVDAEFGMVKISEGLDLLDTLKREFANIRPKIRPDQKALTYEEIRERVHDDLVIASALAHWAARRFSRRIRVVDLPPAWRGANVDAIREAKRRNRPA